MLGNHEGIHKSKSLYVYLQGAHPGSPTELQGPEETPGATPRTPRAPLRPPMHDQRALWNTHEGIGKQNLPEVCAKDPPKDCLESPTDPKIPPGITCDPQGPPGTTHGSPETFWGRNRFTYTLKRPPGDHPGVPGIPQGPKGAPQGPPRVPQRPSLGPRSPCWVTMKVYIKRNRCMYTFEGPPGANPGSPRYPQETKGTLR